MKIKFATCSLAAALGLSLVSPASGALVAYDPFLVEDPVGPETNNGNRGLGQYDVNTSIGGQGAAALGWNGTPDGFGVGYAQTTSNYQPNAIGENSNSVAYEQGGRLQWLGVGNFPANRNITRQLKPTPSSNTWYFSIITNRLGWADVQTNTYAVGGFTDAAGAGLQVGYDDTLGNNIPDLVLRAGGQNFVVAADAASSSTQYVLARLTINTSGNDIIDVFVNPAALTTEGALGVAAASINTVNVSDTLTPFTQSKFQSPGQSGPVYWDEIRLATDFASMVPEPASLALLALGGLSVLGRRSRRVA